MNINIIKDTKKNEVRINRNGFSEKVVWRGRANQLNDAYQAVEMSVQFTLDINVKLRTIEDMFE